MKKWMVLSLLFVPAAAADINPDQAGVAELRQMVTELQGEVAQLKNQDNAWLNNQRANELRNLVHDVLADADNRSSLLGEGATAGYGGGFFITSADNTWKLKINGQIQARWLYNKASNQNLLTVPLEDSQHGFEQRRTKVKFSGHVLDPSWTFKISQTWSRSGGSNTEDAYIQKKFDDGSWFKFGQFKQNFLRENIVSSSKQLGVDRSMLDNAFTYGWSQGLELGWKDDDVKLFVQYTDGPNRSNTAALGNPTDSFVARAEFKFGDASFKDFGYLTSKAGAKDGFMIGVAYQTYDIDGTGTFEYGNANATESDGWTIDASWRGDGWNLFGYIVEATGKDSDGVEQDSSGLLIQGGFLANDNLELFAQYEEGEIDNATFTDGSNDMSVFRIGFNYWPYAGKNNIKWTTDIGWAGDSIANGGGSGISSADWVSSGNGWRSDSGTNDDQMLIRTQLQLLF